MAKQIWKPGNMLYPLPVVMVSVRDKKGNDNIITVAWAGTVCTNPPMVSISVRPERHSYQMIKESGEFVINLVTKDLVFATDYCGVKSGRDVDKFKEMKLKKEKAEKVAAPLIAQSPVNLECRVTECKELGSHHMFVAEIVSVHIDEKYMDEKGKFHLNETGLV
ncbi:MAG: flavin reductase family protein, partial [Lachnospiraceae bacterium]|nr:flavin reductase family protein [Lachnospiraceae bacterium]